MAGTFDSIFGYGYDTSGLGLGTSSPVISNPVNSYLQQNNTPSMMSPTSLSQPNIGMMSGLGGYGPGDYPVRPGASNNNGLSSGLGMNLDTGKLVLGGLQTIGSIWNAWEANKMAKKQFAFQKDFSTNNLVNQIKSYNTSLEDRARARAHTEGRPQTEADAYVEKNRLEKTF